ncbi:hypothetical protein CHS0354_034187 [Potamilus streckersoni]|uniref:Uncharacterized protein n=1 Tax=Potamilus streckersoni TaxID=2493646 RepID=A0AAE0RN99_9BIVA|nr:hypothetical protein CHS0354_034187 [Potamilus streckersoni]
MLLLAAMFLIMTLTDGHSLMELPKVLLVSFDGFRWDYLLNMTKNTPNFNRIIKNGVYARRGLKNCFVTKTYPNHYTIVTGQYEETHGIVGNDFYDPLYNETFMANNDSQVRDPKWFNMGGQPIWVTNQLADIERRSGVVYWPGDAASVDGVLPSHYLPYTGYLKNKTRIDTVLDWFTVKNPINLGLLYFEEPDSIGHIYGPYSEQVVGMVEALDKDVLGYLLHRLEEAELLDKINLIITSDHGMANISDIEKNKIDLDQYVNPLSYRVLNGNPVISILPVPNTTAMIDEIFRNLSGRPNLNVYRKEEIPVDYHFTHNRRIMPIVVVPDEGYWISYNKSGTSVGVHGYNNSLSSMHPIFLAMGPGFKNGVSVDTFNNVDIYPLLCHLLKINPHPNNGSLDNVRDLLKEEMEDGGPKIFIAYMAILLFCGLIGGVYSVAACRVHRIYKRYRIQSHSLVDFPRIVHYTSSLENGVKIPLMTDTSDDDFVH